ncbi:MAG: hypothetical protein ACRDFB_05270 [Rhabdochlamydiaceae bacterium]
MPRIKRNIRSDIQRKRLLNEISTAVEEGMTITDACKAVSVGQGLYYHWLKQYGLTTPKRAQSTTAKIESRITTPPQTQHIARVMVDVDMDMLVKDNKDRILRRMLIGKPEHIKTAVIELLR